MLRSVLVGLNGTKCSRSATAYAIELAKKYRASLMGLGVVDRPRLCPMESVPLGAGAFKQERDDAVLNGEHVRIDRLLVEFAQAATAVGTPCQTMKLEADPAEALAVESQRVDVLVIGKKHLPEEKWEEHSHTMQRILHHTARPVLCVPENATGGGAVVVAYDGSLQAAKTLQLFVATGLADDQEIHLLTVADDAAVLAQRGIQFLHSHGFRVEAHIEAGNHAARQILETASRLNAGMIVMGAYGKPRLREFMFGSVTKAVLRESRVPLFLYH